MRLICTFEFEGNLELPIHYNHIVQGFIYENITDKALSSFLHEVGFKAGKRNYKMFTFSKIFGVYKINREKKTITFQSPIKVHISSLVDDFTNDITTTFFKSDRLYLGNKEIKLAGIQSEYPIFNKRETKIEMLAPIVIYSTIKIDGRAKTIYYSPEDSLFSEKIRENILRKYKAIYEKDVLDDEFHIQYIGKQEPKASIIKYHNTIIKGYNGKYILSGNPELIRLSYFVGLGSKNSQGFGCFNLLKR